MELKAETAYCIISALSNEEKAKLFVMIGVMPKLKAVKKRQVNLDIESMAIIALEQHRKKMSKKK